MTTNKALEKLKSKLPRNYRSVLAGRTGKSKNTVYLAVKGDIDNPEIIKAAIALAKEEVDKNDDMLKSIQSL